ncbi:hypothetical protein RclHR1_07400009 [Rhizophagus clarus]|uniref:RRM domain-containing protein n=1 Tax=Rhizophagus clarus TaxID=94130 RepID=A0A2Z6SCZ9_9GLOM|nr:hypothetical protein RclHR1_07400009 [Rhizophagus clarus]
MKLFKCFALIFFSENPNDKIEDLLIDYFSSRFGNLLVKITVSTHSRSSRLVFDFQRTEAASRMMHVMTYPFMMTV